MCAMSAEGAVRLKGRGRPIVLRFIGDSHAFVFDAALFETTAEPRRLVFTRLGLYIVACRARDFTDLDGCLNPRIASWLLDERLIPPVCAIGASNAAVKVAPLVISCGDGDFRGDFLRLGIPRDELESPSTRAQVERRFVPLYRAVEMIRCAQLTPIVLTAVPPPTADDALFERIHRFATTAEYRATAARLFNDVNRRLCVKHGVAFVDVWDALAKGDGIDPAYTSDGVHLTAKASMVVLNEIAAHLDVLR